MGAGVCTAKKAAASSGGSSSGSGGYLGSSSGSGGTGSLGYDGGFDDLYKKGLITAAVKTVAATAKKSAKSTKKKK